MLLLQHMHPLKLIDPVNYDSAAKMVAYETRNAHCPNHLYALPMMYDNADA